MRTEKIRTLKPVKQPSPPPNGESEIAKNPPVSSNFLMWHNLDNFGFFLPFFNIQTADILNCV